MAILPPEGAILPDVNPQAPFYPLKFRPRFFPRMWGGRKLESVLGKPLPDSELIGESWEVYDFPPGVVENSGAWLSAEVAEGALYGRTLHDLLIAMPQRLLGQTPALATPAGPQFPLLIKFLDARQDLSVQVHPDEAYAAAHPGAYAKSEAWYVLHCERGARLLKGVRPGVSRADFRASLDDGTLERLLVSIPARTGDVHYLPSGTVHALGAGMLVAEVQTPSDTTFRVYDFDRVDPATGRPRPLHVDEALEMIQFNDYAREQAIGGGNLSEPFNDSRFTPAEAEKDGLLVAAPQFVLSRWSAHQGMRTPLNAGVTSVLIIVEGEAGIIGEEFEEVRARRGEVILLPADLTGQQLDAETDCVWLEVTFAG